MALTPWRWAAAAVVGALCVLTFAFTPRDVARYEPEQREVLALRERRLSWLVNETTDRLRASLVIDSLQRAIRPARSDSMRVFFGGVPASARPVYLRAVQKSLEAVGSPTLPVDVVFVVDTAQQVRGRPRPARLAVTGEYVLPVAAGDRCLSVVRLRWPFDEQGNDGYVRLANQMTVYRLLGPCAYVGAFGRPGPHVARWLAEGAWGYSLVAGWQRRAPEWSAPSWARDPEERSWALRNFMGVSGYRCATGDLESCEASAVAPSPPGRASALPRVWGGRVVSTNRSDNEWWHRLNLGPRQANFLSDLVFMAGPENFRRFWTSDAPVPDAFAAATGKTLASATHDWTQAQYVGRVSRGTPLSPLTAGVAFLFIGASAAGAVVAARQRRAR